MRSLLRSVRELCPTTEGPSLRRRAVTFRSGRSPGSRVDSRRLALPIERSTVGFGPKSRLQWRYRGGLSPPSLFSLGGHLNGQCFYVIVPVMIWLRSEDCQEGIFVIRRMGATHHPGPKRDGNGWRSTINSTSSITRAPTMPFGLSSSVTERTFRPLRGLTPSRTNSSHWPQ